MNDVHIFICPTYNDQTFSGSPESARRFYDSRDVRIDVGGSTVHVATAATPLDAIRDVFHALRDLHSRGIIQ